MVKGPKYKVLQRVKVNNVTGIVRKVWTTDPKNYKYTVDFMTHQSIVHERDMKKA